MNFFMWVLSLILCFAIEYAIQSTEGIIGMGIIASIFMFLAFFHDFIVKEKKE